MAEPDAPIPAVRVEAAAAAPEPMAAPAAAPVVAAIEPAAIAAEVPAAIVPAADKVELVGEKPSLLEAAGKPEPAKPAAEEIKPEPAKEAAKPEDKKPEAAAAEPAKDPAKPEEAKPAVVEPAKAEPLAAIEYKYELPATLKLDDALKGEVHAAFDAFRADPGAGAQALIDLHARTMQSFADGLHATALRDQHKAFNETRTGWHKDIMADPELGGSGFQTASKAVARMRDMLISSAVPGTPEYQQHLKEAEDFYRITGAGDHPVLWRILHNAARVFDEPGLPPQNIKPAANNGRAPGAKRDRMYDHPSSSKASS